ncbi:uncharacterized protein LOC144130473 [Amblyomma americanum]
MSAATGARRGGDTREAAPVAVRRLPAAAEELPGHAFASSSGGLSGALMSLVILALFLIFIVTMTARYLHAAQPAVVSMGTASSRNLTGFDNGTDHVEKEQEVREAENQTLLEPPPPSNRSS